MVPIFYWPLVTLRPSSYLPGLGSIMALPDTRWKVRASAAMASPVSQHQADIYALSIIYARSCQRSRSRRIWPLPWISLDTSWEESAWLHASALNWGGLPQGGGGYRTDLGWALHESCSVLRDPRGEPALQACVPWWSSWTFWSPLGAASSGQRAVHLGVIPQRTRPWKGHRGWSFAEAAF